MMKMEAGEVLILARGWVANVNLMQQICVDVYVALWKNNVLPWSSISIVSYKVRDVPHFKSYLYSTWDLSFLYYTLDTQHYRTWCVNIKIWCPMDRLWYHIRPYIGLNSSIQNQILRWGVLLFINSFQVFSNQFLIWVFSQ